VRCLCIAAWLATTTIHMWLELWLLRAAPGPLPGITIVGTRYRHGGYVHIVPYVCSLAFCSVMTALTFGGARRSAPSLGALELLRLQTPKGARSQRGQMLIHRLLSAHLRYNLVSRRRMRGGAEDGKARPCADTSVRPSWDSPPPSPSVSAAQSGHDTR
jgi:hypothetical protein